jgi:hypothetical protein
MECLVFIRPSQEVQPLTWGSVGWEAGWLGLYSSPSPGDKALHYLISSIVLISGHRVGTHGLTGGLSCILMHGLIRGLIVF